jgi:hypothetical protein
MRCWDHNTSRYTTLYVACDLRGQIRWAGWLVIGLHTVAGARCNQGGNYWHAADREEMRTAGAWPAAWEAD